jgi:two-component system cell cycle response regulator
MDEYSMRAQEQISELKEKYSELLEGARRNETILRKFQNFEIQLMDSESLEEFLDQVICHSKEIFNWDYVTLVLVDSDYEIQRLFEQSDHEITDNPNLFFIHENSCLTRIYQGLLSPLLTRYQLETHAILFPDADTQPASIALLPLLHKGRLIGSYNIGSNDKDRFDENAGADFLKHLAAVIAVCLDNNLAREHLKYLGLIDNLTGVNNRRYFDQRLTEEISRIRRSGNPSSCLFIDADHFKNINDTYGHQTGDQVLRYIAQVIREQVRQIDVVARYGGEEFTVILLQTASEKAMEIAERIRQMIAARPYEDENENEISLTVSIGISTLSAEEIQHAAEAANRFVEQADQALYIAKNSGRNKTLCYDRDALLMEQAEVS